MVSEGVVGLRFVPRIYRRDFPIGARIVVPRRKPRRSLARQELLALTTLGSRGLICLR
jgi:hypothetical protein